MFRYLRWRRARKLVREGAPRPIRVHSVTPVPESGGAPRFFRVAFEFLDPPGPWSIQFYEAAPGQNGLMETVEPGTRAIYFESEDGARTRVIVLGKKDEEQRPLLPR